ncbi:MAG: flagellar hook-length control protein FliK [Thermoguttaceae bacterium]
MSVDLTATYPIAEQLSSIEMNGSKQVYREKLQNAFIGAFRDSLTGKQNQSLQNKVELDIKSQKADEKQESTTKSSEMRRTDRKSQTQQEQRQNELREEYQSQTDRRTQNKVLTDERGENRSMMRNLSDKSRDFSDENNFTPLTNGASISPFMTNSSASVNEMASASGILEASNFGQHIVVAPSQNVQNPAMLSGNSAVMSQGAIIDGGQSHMMLQIPSAIPKSAAAFTVFSTAGRFHDSYEDSENSEKDEDESSDVPNKSAKKIKNKSRISFFGPEMIESLHAARRKISPETKNEAEKVQFIDVPAHLVKDEPNKMESEENKQKGKMSEQVQVDKKRRTNAEIRESSPDQSNSAQQVSPINQGDSSLQKAKNSNQIPETAIEMQWDRVRFVQRITDAMNAASSKNTVRLKIHLEGLGSLGIFTEFHGQKVRVQFQTESKAIQTLLAETFDDLKSSLFELGFETEIIL